MSTKGNARSSRSRRTLGSVFLATALASQILVAPSARAIPSGQAFVVDELSGGFSWAGINRLDAAYGYGGHMFYTGATPNYSQPSCNARGHDTGTWTYPVPVNGYYDVQVFVPNAHGSTGNARYQVFSGTSLLATVSVNQLPLNNVWIQLGRFWISQGQGRIVLDDVTGEACLTKEVAYDAVQWIYRGTPAIRNVQTTPGYVAYPIQTSGAPNNYFGLGDSYSSGEGNPGFLPPSNTNGCHRSYSAWPRLVAAQWNRGAFDFWACSGALMSDIYPDPNCPPPVCLPAIEREIEQISRVAGKGQANASAGLVTLSIGGNDLLFKQVLEWCVNLTFGRLRPGDCRRRWEVEVSQQIQGLRWRLNRIYKEVSKRAPNANVVVVTYPRMFKRTPYRNGRCTPGVGVNYFWQEDINWLNRKVDQANLEISRAAAGLPRVKTVNVTDEFQGHELCSSTPWVHSVNVLDQEYSFHPNVPGHEALARRVETALGLPLTTSSPRASSPSRILSAPSAVQAAPPNLAIERTVRAPLGGWASTSFTIPSGGNLLRISSSWADYGQDVAMQLVSPSGAVIKWDTTGSNVTHQLGPTSEEYTVATTQAGTWTVQLYGSIVPDAGEDALVSVASMAADETPPVTTATLSPEGFDGLWLNVPSATISMTAADIAGGAGMSSLVYGAAGTEPIDDTTVSTTTAMRTFTAEGETFFGYYATDVAGNIEEAHLTTIRIDRTPPAASYDTAADALILSAPTAPGKITGSAGDPLSGVESVAVRFESLLSEMQQGEVKKTCDEDNHACTWSAEAPVVPGLYTVHMTAADSAGNRSVDQTLRIIVA